MSSKQANNNPFARERAKDVFTFQMSPRAHIFPVVYVLNGPAVDRVAFMVEKSALEIFSSPSSSVSSCQLFL
jgi:hypothetical protein